MLFPRNKGPRFFLLFSLLDVDECQSNTSNICEQECVNVPGSFTCDCDNGYKLNADGRSCDGNTFDEMTILFNLIIDNFPYKTDRPLKLEIRSEILKTVPN